MCLWYERVVNGMWMCLQANGWENGQWMEWKWLCCTASGLHRLKTELFLVAIYIYIYCDRSVWERDKRETTGIKSVHLEDCFRLWLAWLDRKDKQQTTNSALPNNITFVIAWLLKNQQCYQKWRLRPVFNLQSSNITTLITVWIKATSVMLCTSKLISASIPNDKLEFATSCQIHCGRNKVRVTRSKDPMGADCYCVEVCCIGCQHNLERKGF